MVVAVATHSNLQAIYNSLVQSGVTSLIQAFLQAPDAAKHVAMVNAINAWQAGDAHLKSIGLTSADTLPGLRVIVGDPTGSRVFDTFSLSNNQYANIDVPAADFATTGKYKLGKNIHSFPNVMQAILSQSGVSIHSKYNTAANAKTLTITYRLGHSANEPVGCVAVAMNAPDA